MSAIPNLTPTEEAKLKAVIAKLTAASLPEALKLRKAAADDFAAAQLMRKGMTEQSNPELAAQYRATYCRAIEGDTLYGQFLILMQDGTEVSVEDILANPDIHDKGRCHDPLDREYGGPDPRIGYISLSGDKPYIYSHAHGGVTFYLLANRPALTPEECEALYTQLKAQIENAKDEVELLQRLAPRVNKSGLSASLIDSLRKRIAKRTGVTITSLKADALANATPQEVNQSGYLERMNARFALITIGGTAYFLDEKSPDEDTDHQLLREAAFHTSLFNEFVPVMTNSGPDMKPISRWWLAHSERRRLARIVFTPPPLVAKDDEFNLWRGFNVEPSRECDLSRWALYKAHIETIVCGGDTVLAGYFWAWLADLVQRPGGGKPGVAIALRGGRGTGKGQAVRPILRIVGRHGMQINNRERLTGRFNAHLANKVLVVLDEAFWAGDLKGEGVLKGLITEPTMDVERKNVDAFSVASFSRFLICSNENWCVPAGADERRFVVMDVPSDRAGDYQYFAAMHEQMVNGGDAHLLRWLLDYDLTGVELRRAPQTKGLMDQKIASQGSIGEWWLSSLREGDVGCLECEWEPAGDISPSCYAATASESAESADESNSRWPEFVPTKRLYDKYIEYTKKMGRRPATETAFIQRLKELCPDITKKKRGTKEQRTNGYVLPPLAHCREAYEKMMSGGISWED